MRRFELVREKDISGVSGTGVVAQGVVFWDGAAAMRWFEPAGHQSTSFYADIEDVIAIHGHSGATSVRFIDEE